MAALSCKMVFSGKEAMKFIRAAKEGDVAKIRLCLEAGLDVNVEDMHGLPALFYAASEGYEAIAEILLEAGANVNSPYGNYKNYMPLLTAVYRGRTKVSEIFLRSGAIANFFGISTPHVLKHFAVVDEKKEIAEKLLCAGASIGFDWNQLTETESKKLVARAIEFSAIQSIVALFAENVPEPLRDKFITTREETIQHMHTLAGNTRDLEAYVSYMNIVNALRFYSEQEGARRDEAREIVSTLLAMRPLLWQAADATVASDRAADCTIPSLHAMLRVIAMRQRKSVPRFEETDGDDSESAADDRPAMGAAAAAASGVV